MRLKTFHARTVAEAMRQVRTTLGDEAIIVATREEEGGSVRVTAAIEDDDLGPSACAAVAASDARNSTSRNSASRNPAAALIVDDQPDVAQFVTDALYRHGAPALISEKLVDTLENLDVDDPVLALSAALDAVFTFQPLAEGRLERPVMLVGAPGSGKTLVAAKLAVRAVFRKSSIGIITTDTVRAGAIEQLSAFTRLIKIKLITVEDESALGDALDVTRGAEQIVIDTAGRNPFDPAEMNELRRMIAGTAVEPVLVMPAGIDAVEAAEMGGLFRAIGVRRVLITRLDLTRRFGSMMAAVYDSRLNFCDVSLTSNVADGLTPLSPLTLARLMMPGQERTARANRQTGTHS